MPNPYTGLYYYAGPAKTYINSIALQPEGENGATNVVIDEKTADVASALTGSIAQTFEEPFAKVSTTPFDNWGNLATLFPIAPVSVGGVAGALQIGQNPFSGAEVKVWTPDGRLYDFVNGAITKHPIVFLGPSKPLFNACEISLIGDPTKNPGDAGFLMNGPITESGAADPGGQFTMEDFIRGRWTGAWGAIAGFTALEAEDFWQISVAAKYSFQQVQKVTKRAKMDSVEIMAKARLVGPSHTQLLAKILAHTSGSVMAEGLVTGGAASATDLVLSGPSAKTITLKNCEVKTNAGFEFGGTSLNTGEVGFIRCVSFAGGVGAPVLLFSA